MKPGAGTQITVTNAQGTNALKVYPFGTEVIEAGTAGAAYSIAAATAGQSGKTAIFTAFASGIWHVMLSNS
jgi:hypothetical protein